jgi:hypothetical protein
MVVEMVFPVGKIEISRGIIVGIFTMEVFNVQRCSLELDPTTE